VICLQSKIVIKRAKTAATSSPINLKLSPRPDVFAVIQHRAEFLYRTWHYKSMCEAYELDTSVKIAELLLTQAGVREIERVKEMTAFVKGGGFFTPEEVGQFHVGEENPFGLVVLSQFPDGSTYIHDGCHRSVSTYLGGREYFAVAERRIIKWNSLDAYSIINPAKGWVTPFDLLTEVRLADIKPFKTEALALPASELEAFVQNNRHRYCTKRIYHTIADLGAHLFSGLAS
jgi:hypothetical protein